MKKNQVIYFLSVILIFVLGACSSSETDKQLIDDNAVMEENAEASSSNQQPFFQLPSPVELFMFLWEDGAPFNAANLNSIDNVSKYVESKKKAINLGIYSADLAYCTIYDKNQETMNLFSATKRIAEDLGLTEGFDQTILERIDQNIDNSDSLYQITSDSYSKTLTFLQSQGQTKILPYIVYGGWLESVFIATQTVKRFTPGSEIAVRITDQGLLLENLVEFFQSIEADDSNATLILKDLNELTALYNEAIDTEDGIMSKDIYKKIKTKIELIRKEVIK
jgi:hypothetical protein